MDGFTDIELDCITVQRGTTKLDVSGIFARVFWEFDRSELYYHSPDLMVTDDKGNHSKLNTSDPWLAEVAAAARKHLLTPKIAGRIHDEVESEAWGQREAANENARRFQAAE